MSVNKFQINRSDQIIPELNLKSFNLKISDQIKSESKISDLNLKFSDHNFSDSDQIKTICSDPYYECKQRLNELGSRNKVTLIWVPGHEGIPGNEKSDELARLGAENRFIGPEPKFGISMTTRKYLVKNWLRNEHSRT